MRYAPLEFKDMTPRQREVADGIRERHDGAVSGPNVALLYSPDVADRVDLLGAYLQFNVRVPERLRVLAVLIAAGRHRIEDVAPFMELKSTADSGLAQLTIAALRDGRRPSKMEEDEQLVYEYCSEIVKSGRARSDTFDRIANCLGKELCLELLEVCGFTLFLTTLLNVTGTTLQDR